VIGCLGIIFEDLCSLGWELLFNLLLFWEKSELVLTGPLQAGKLNKKGIAGFIFYVIWS